jgi:transcriptional regulator of NAD metabolism
MFVVQVVGRDAICQLRAARIYIPATNRVFCQLIRNKCAHSAIADCAVSSVRSASVKPEFKRQLILQHSLATE